MTGHGKLVRVKAQNARSSRQDDYSIEIHRAAAQRRRGFSLAMAAFADPASRKLLRGADAAAVGMSFGLDGLWQLIAGLLGSALHLLVMPFEALWHLLQTAVSGVAHLAILPFQALWHLLQSTAAGIGACFDGLWHIIPNFFASLAAMAGSAAHLLATPFEALWHLLQSTAAGIGAGINGLWRIIPSFFASLAAMAGSAAHLLDTPFEALWHWLQTAANYMQGVFPSLVAAAHELVPALEAFWQWLKAAATAALPYVLLIAALACLVALACFFGPFLCAAAGSAVAALVSAVCSCVRCVCVPCVAIAKALVVFVCWTGQYLHLVAMGIGRALAFVLPVCSSCCSCCATVTMKAPGAAGFLISRAAFVEGPRLYFQILHAGGAVVAAAVYSAPAVASAVAAPVAALFRF